MLRVPLLAGKIKPAKLLGMPEMTRHQLRCPLTTAAGEFSVGFGNTRLYRIDARVLVSSLPRSQYRCSTCCLVRRSNKAAQVLCAAVASVNNSLSWYP